MWYAAHVCVTFEADGVAGRVLLEESIFLVEGSSINSIRERMEEFEEVLGGATSYPGFKRSGPARIRKIVAILNLDGGNDSQPTDKTEVTYELLQFDSHVDLENYIKGESVRANLEAHIKRTFDS